MQEPRALFDEPTEYSWNKDKYANNLCRCFHCNQRNSAENGAEDIAVLPNGLAFFSSGLHDYPVGHFKQSAIVGKIYTFNFNHSHETPKELKIEGVMSINPHGLSLWQNEEGEVFLFVVNHHPNGADSVDKFLLDAKTHSLLHKMSVSSEDHSHIEAINDLVVVGENRFYYTNYLSKQLPEGIQTFGRVAWGSIGYFDGQKTSLVHENLLLPNGINISPDLKYIYVSHLGRMEILVFDRFSDGSLALKNNIQIGTMADNLDVDRATGSIWTGAHSNVFGIIRYSEDPTRHKSASQVLKINMKDGDMVNMTEVFADDGEYISGTSSAVHFKNKILVGTVFTNLMYCEVN
ncbi:hypothetical protein CAPTEDRAFT_193248 [Capitella teleta]|uniref:Paraoxonase n=1 Tax=Capitella teleta TaxID=283909 RepID=R7UZD7_CAPTE|nr:hypothetical protein CAPTEDRAFT_193248 [Capitella teleta]|eukprot:ELU08791.1 hypothetical protein CAPTEDRAFT_193248 [Capitella teleta]